MLFFFFFGHDILPYLPLIGRICFKWSILRIISLLVYWIIWSIRPALHEESGQNFYWNFCSVLGVDGKPLGELRYLIEFISQFSELRYGKY